MTVKPRILFVSDSYLDYSRLLGSTHQSFLQALAAVADNVTFFHANGFESADKRDAQLKHLLEQQLPNLVLSINAAGYSDPLLSYLQKNRPHAITWFWDDPNNVVDQYQVTVAMQNSQVFNACTDFRWYDGQAKQVPMAYLPFSSIDAKPHEETPSRGVGFLGTLWHSQRVFQYAATGLTCLQNGQAYLGETLLQALQGPTYAKSGWQAIGGQTLSATDVQNAFSALKRIHMLSWLQHTDLHIYGQHDWQYHLWSVAPELLPRVHYQTVYNHTQMRQLLSQHWVSLNIFHLQNRHGGPNFRILDSAVHGSAILSDFNQGCAELFPAEEAALYFSSPVEAAAQAERLLNDSALRQKLTRHAAAIVNNGHTHRHRVAFFLAQAGLSPTEGCEPVTVVSDTMHSNVVTAEVDLSNTSTTAEDSVYHQVESYYVTMGLQHAQLTQQLDAQSQKLAEQQTQIKQLKAALLDKKKPSKWRKPFKWLVKPFTRLK